MAVPHDQVPPPAGQLLAMAAKGPNDMFLAGDTGPLAALCRGDPGPRCCHDHLARPAEPAAPDPSESLNVLSQQRVAEVGQTQDRQHFWGVFEDDLCERAVAMQEHRLADIRAGLLADWLLHSAYASRWLSQSKVRSGFRVSGSK